MYYFKPRWGITFFCNFLYLFKKCNFPLNHNVCLSVCLSQKKIQHFLNVRILDKCRLLLILLKTPSPTLHCIWNKGKLNEMSFVVTFNHMLKLISLCLPSWLLFVFFLESILFCFSSILADNVGTSSTPSPSWNSIKPSDY